jgi:hypothetical protein
MHGEVLARVLAGDSASYDRGVWFNSAKFFDLEYQTYGFVNMDQPNEKNLYWEADDGLHALRIVYDDARVIGFNCMGVRWRHRTCERWIQERRSVEHVIAHIEQANFDPEFFRRYEYQLRRAWQGSSRERSGRDDAGRGSDDCARRSARSRSPCVRSARSRSCSRDSTCASRAAGPRSRELQAVAIGASRFGSSTRTRRPASHNGVFSGR